MQGVCWMPCQHPLVTSDSSMQEVQDHLLCEALIGMCTATEKIMETVVTCKFIDPSIEISARELYFRVEKVSLDCILAFSSLKGGCACVKAPLYPS